MKQEIIANFKNLYYKELKKLDREQQSFIIKTGFQGLDGANHEFLPGDLIVISGLPSVGKTIFLLNLALNISREHSSIFYPLSNSSEKIMRLIMANKSGVPIWHIEERRLENDDKMRVTSCLPEINKHKLFIYDCGIPSFDLLEKHCKMIIKERGAKVIFIDDLNILTSMQGFHKKTMLSYTTLALKSLAKKYDVCIIAATQLNPERKRTPLPKLSDLPGSPFFIQNADKIIFVDRGPDYFDDMHVRLVINKSGSGASIYLKDDLSTCELEEKDMSYHL